jgi:flavin reductase (DIM6/NTAB) family NADH-FMN oxidoreductase RutF
MTHFDPRDLTPKDQYKLMSGSIVPRPIALVTTVGPHGTNAAPFSLFQMIGVDPPILMFSASPRAGEVKDTIRNIEANGEFVVHIVNSKTLERMNLCSADFPAEDSEIDFCGFETAPSLKVKPPRLVECPAQFECTLSQVLRIGNRPNVVVFGEVIHFHYHDGVVDERLYVQSGVLDPIGRLAGNGSYTRITDRFTMARPDIPGVPATSG